MMFNRTLLQEEGDEGAIVDKKKRYFHQFMCRYEIRIFPIQKGLGPGQVT